MKPIKISMLTSALSVALLTTIAVNAVPWQEQDARENARAAAIAASKAFGSEQKVVLEEPARSYVDWGAILQPNGKILSVRENSVASTMGVEVGDRLTHINGVAINQGELATTLETFERLEHGETFTVNITRNNQSLELTGTALATVIPGWRLEVVNQVEEHAVGQSSNKNCGRLTVFFTPPETADLYPAFVNTIDGENVRVRNPNFKLAVGRHQIGLHELIDNPSIRRGQAIDAEKIIEIDVEPNKKYHLAAHFIREKRFERRDAGYWEPVVWRVTEQTCTLD